MEQRSCRITFVETKFRPIKSGRYKAKLININENEVGSFGQPLFIFEFQIIGGEYHECDVNALVNKSVNGEYGIRNKMGKMIMALTGKELSLWNGCDLFELIGMKCFVDIELEKDRRSGKPINKIISFE